MAHSRRSRSSQGRLFALHKPQGQISQRVQVVGPKHFGIVCFDCAKARSKFLFSDFFGKVLLDPTVVEHTQGELQAALARVRQLMQEHDVRDTVVAIERTGTYHRPVQETFRRAGFDTRLVHPYASRQFRQPADAGNKTDDTDLAGIFRATVNGFGLIDPVWSDDYQQLQLLSRHRRDFVQKNARLLCQLREYLHSLMPGYAACFEHLFESVVALPLARHFASAQAVRAAGIPGLHEFVKQANIRHVRVATLTKILAWAETAAPAHPQTELLRGMIDALDDDRHAKTQQILKLEQQSAHLLVRTPYVLLLAIPGINVVSAVDFVGELGPIDQYANANRITGRAGLRPSRYQSDQVDRPNGPLRSGGNRRLRAALMQIADNLVNNNHHFQVKISHWKAFGKDPRWSRVKVAKNFSRLAYAMLTGRSIFGHPCCQPRHAILNKLLEFHTLHDTPMPEVLHDLDLATQQLPRSVHAAEAQPLHQRFQEIQRQRKRGPQPLSEILPIVLAKLGVTQVKSTPVEQQDPG